ncbi:MULTISPECIES: hypothetical protein [Aurantimonas]|uniref:hypothetical protein n=1 Tax=Aurantimonas TaxID=182269 RepID=UPI00351926F6
MVLPQHEGWVAWAGGKSAPVGDDVIVEVKYRGELRHVATMPAGNFSWAHWGDGTDIIAYRFVAQKLSLESGKIYLDEDGYVHGPMVETESVFYAGGMGSWLPDGEPADSDSVRLIGEWIAPVPQHAAEENERLRRQVRQLQTRIDVFDGLSRADANNLAKRLFVDGVAKDRHRSKVFHECLIAVDKLLAQVERYREDRADLMLAEGRMEAHESAVNMQVLALCDLVGRRVHDRLRHDQRALFGCLADGINFLVLNQRLMESEMASAEEKS